MIGGDPVEYVGQDIEVSSTAISAVSFNEVDLEMTVTFRSGGTYTLTGVSREEFEGFMNAPSKGSYWLNRMRGKY